jgi:DNA-binding NarL/FixJ family response regulator
MRRASEQEVAMGDPVTVSVFALDPVLEAGATSTLRACPDVALVGSGEQAGVSVVIVDDLDDTVLDLVRTARSTPSRPEVVIVATSLGPSEVLHAIAAGVRGLLRRCEASPDRLTRAVLTAASGDCTVSPDMLATALHKGAAGPINAHGNLSERERAVLGLVADGHETNEIARTLSYSTRTVTSVIHDITHRFRLRNRAHAVAYALRTGLL